MSDPTNLKVLDEVQFLTGYKVEPVLANESIIMRVLENYGHYKHEEFDNKQRPDTARPLDFRKPAPAAPRAKLEENVEIVLEARSPPRTWKRSLTLRKPRPKAWRLLPTRMLRSSATKWSWSRRTVPGIRAELARALTCAYPHTHPGKN